MVFNLYVVKIYIIKFFDHYHSKRYSLFQKKKFSKFINSSAKYSQSEDVTIIMQPRIASKIGVKRKLSPSKSKTYSKNTRSKKEKITLFCRGTEMCGKAADLERLEAASKALKGRIMAKTDPYGTSWDDKIQPL